MKKVLGVIAIAATLMACKGGKPDNAGNTMVLSAADSIKMKEFEKWKDKEETKKNTVVYKEPVSTTKEATTVEKKKGWSKAAKGAVIGGVTGAAAGAVINKRNRAAGAVIGGAVGAGVGYGIGRSKDKKDGRY